MKKEIIDGFSRIAQILGFAKPCDEEHKVNRYAFYGNGFLIYDGITPETSKNMTILFEYGSYFSDDYGETWKYYMGE